MICWARRSRRGRSSTVWVASSATVTTSSVHPATPGVMVSRAVISAAGQNDLNGVQGAEDEPADAESEGQGDAGCQELQRCFQEGDGQQHAEPHERHGRADELSGCRHLVHAPVGLVDGAGRGTSVSG